MRCDINNGRVDLQDVPDIRPELKEIVLAQDQDPFFKKNMYQNFGDLGPKHTLRNMWSEVQTKARARAKALNMHPFQRRSLQEREGGMCSNVCVEVVQFHQAIVWVM